MKMKNKNPLFCIQSLLPLKIKNSPKRQYTTISLTNYSEVSEPSSSSSSSSSAVRNTLMSRGEPAEAPLGTSTVVVISLSTITLSWVQYLKCSKEENTTPVSVLYTFNYSYTTQRLYSLSYITTTQCSAATKSSCCWWCLNVVHPQTFSLLPYLLLLPPFASRQFSSSLAYRSIGRATTSWKVIRNITKHWVCRSYQPDSRTEPFILFLWMLCFKTCMCVGKTEHPEETTWGLEKKVSIKTFEFNEAKNMPVGNSWSLFNIHYFFSHCILTDLLWNSIFNIHFDESLGEMTCRHE